MMMDKTNTDARINLIDRSSLIGTEDPVFHGPVAQLGERIPRKNQDGVQVPLCPPKDPNCNPNRFRSRRV